MDSPETPAAPDGQPPDPPCEPRPRKRRTPETNAGESAPRTKSRRGRRKPRRKGRGSITERDARVEFVKQLLDTFLKKGGFSKSITFQAIRKQYGDLSARTCQEYLTRAIKILEEDKGLDREHLQFESLCFYDGIIANPAVDWGNRLRARERKDKLLGLEQPKKVVHEGEVGVKHSATELAGLAPVFEKVLENPDLLAGLWREAVEPGATPVEAAPTPPPASENESPSESA